MVEGDFLDLNPTKAACELWVWTNYFHPLSLNLLSHKMDIISSFSLGS